MEATNYIFLLTVKENLVDYILVHLQYGPLLMTVFFSEMFFIYFSLKKYVFYSWGGWLPEWMLSGRWMDLWGQPLKQTVELADLWWETIDWKGFILNPINVLYLCRLFRLGKLIMYHVHVFHPNNNNNIKVSYGMPIYATHIDRLLFPSTIISVVIQSLWHVYCLIKSTLFDVVERTDHLSIALAGGINKNPGRARLPQSIQHHHFQLAKIPIKHPHNQQTTDQQQPYNQQMPETHHQDELITYRLVTDR